MKPVHLNQLLFHSKTSTLSFFVAPVNGHKETEELQDFLLNMQAQLRLQRKVSVAKLLEKNMGCIRKIILSHPDKAHGFFISDKIQGYMVLENKVETFCMIGQSFHVRPALEELLINPEYMVVNVSLYDISVYRGDFHYLEIVQYYEFDQMSSSSGPESYRLYAPQYMGLVPYKTILAMKAIAQKVKEMTLYHSMPVLVTGIDEMKGIFLKFLGVNSVGVISHLQEDFYEKTCVQIVDRCRTFRSVVLDFYSARLKERLIKMVASKRLISDLGEVITATREGRVIHLVLPTERKIWGRIDFSSGEFEVHKKEQKRNPSVDILNELAEEVMKRGGRIQILGPHFFPLESSVMAILKG